MNSCNVFFYNTGRALGIDNIEEFAKIFGFGKLSGIDLPGEVKGVVPGRSWKKNIKKDSWYEGDTVNMSIGQGYVLATPLQVLEMISIVANDGKSIKPYIVKKIDAADVSASLPHDLNFSKNAMKIVKEGLYKVVNAENGTGKRAKLEGVAIGGKTGTAETPGGITHAWFCGFAPLDNSKMSLVVFLEHGGKGGLEPAGIAKEIFAIAKSKGYL
jgi:Cell division protein FtsI/penicillin-binding protein 2